MLLPLSVVMLVRNEAKRLPLALSILRDRVDEIVVVDMESSDESAMIAKEAGAHVIAHHFVGNFDIARTPGLRASRNEWVLVLDADEEVSDGLWPLIEHHIASRTADCIRIARADFCLSGFAPHESAFPQYHLRLFRRASVDVDGYSGLLHTFYEPLPGARVATIEGVYPSRCLLHFSNPTLFTLMEKFNRYTQVEASNRFVRLSRPWFFLTSLLLVPLRAFLRQYIMRRAFLDGYRGLFMSFSWFVYEWMVHVKAWEMGLHSGRYPSSEDAAQKMRTSVRGESVSHGAHTPS